jgi:hypothetical protein
MALYAGYWLNLAFYILQRDEAVYIHDSYSRTYFVLFQPQSSITKKYSLLLLLFLKINNLLFFWSITQNVWEFSREPPYTPAFWLFNEPHGRRSLCSKICCKVKIAGPFHELEAEQDSVVQSSPDSCFLVSLSWIKWGRAVRWEKHN